MTTVKRKSKQLGQILIELGYITPEQLEGLRLLVTKFPTTWFNQTKHRVTREPVRGVACTNVWFSMLARTRLPNCARPKRTA